MADPSKRTNIETYHIFSREQWCQLSNNIPLKWTEADLDLLSGVNEPVSLTEVLDIYMSLACLIEINIKENYSLYHATQSFLNKSTKKAPYIIGVAGSVASGKSTTSRILHKLLASITSWNVQVIGTDGFLMPTAQLERMNLMARKGFPESYDINALLNFLSDLKSGKPNLSTPYYSHVQYDIDPTQVIAVNQPDVLILEGLNILQTGQTNRTHQVFVSDFIDFSIFVDAPIAYLQQWYCDRIATFLKSTMQDPDAFFHYLTKLPFEEVMLYANKIWREINEPNLINNILPSRYRADCILQKDVDHSVNKILLKKV